MAAILKKIPPILFTQDYTRRQMCCWYILVQNVNIHEIKKITTTVLKYEIETKLAYS